MFSNKNTLCQAVEKKKKKKEKKKKSNDFLRGSV